MAQYKGDKMLRLTPEEMDKAGNEYFEQEGSGDKRTWLEWMLDAQVQKVIGGGDIYKRTEVTCKDCDGVGYFINSENNGEDTSKENCCSCFGTGIVPVFTLLEEIK